MRKCYIQNLAITVTNECNLDCAHCLRGKKNDHTISDEVIEATLNQIKGIQNLAINGGEPTLAINKIERLFETIIKKQIILEEATLTINGTIYSEKLLKLLEVINNYIGEEKIMATFAISLDKFHIEDIIKRGLLEEFKENIQKYQESKYFYGYRKIDTKLFREGNAEQLEKKLTVPLRPMKTLITYIGEELKYDETGLAYIAPILTVSTNGTITESDASIKHQETVYHYGNVLEDSFEAVALKNGKLIKKPKQLEKIAFKEMKRYATYSK